MKHFILACLLPMPLFAKAFPQATIPPTTATPVQIINVSPQINLNTVSVKELTGSFKGIGIKRAESIIQYRKIHKSFKSIDELGNIKGLGKKFLKRNRNALHKIFRV